MESGRDLMDEGERFNEIGEYKKEYSLYGFPIYRYT